MPAVASAEAEAPVGSAARNAAQSSPSIAVAGHRFLSPARLPWRGSKLCFHRQACKFLSRLNAPHRKMWTVTENENPVFIACGVEWNSSVRCGRRALRPGFRNGGRFGLARVEGRVNRIEFDKRIELRAGGIDRRPLEYLALARPPGEGSPDPRVIQPGF